MQRSRLLKEYQEKIRPKLQKELGLDNIMAVPRLEKIVLNVGVKDADDKDLQNALQVLEKISGQKPVRCLAKKSVAAFKLREGMAIGAKVTLRESAMYNFLDKLVNLSLPKWRDFHGVPVKLADGNYNLGVRDWTIFPEIGFDISKKIYGMNITFRMVSKSDEHSFALLRHFKMPFKS
jgi:large subunit ribosomal protein L5